MCSCDIAYWSDAEFVQEMRASMKEGEGMRAGEELEEIGDLVDARFDQRGSQDHNVHRLYIYILFTFGQATRL